MTLKCKKCNKLLSEAEALLWGIFYTEFGSDGRPPKQPIHANCFYQPVSSVPDSEESGGESDG